MKIIFMASVFLLQTLQCMASDDSTFQLTNKATGFCVVKTGVTCDDVRWTTGGRLLVEGKNRCLGVQGKSVGSEVRLYDCDENSELQKWECKNETVLALQGQELYVEPNADGPAVLSKTIGPNSHLTISGTSSGACTRTYRELYTIEGNAAGRMCMFPFMYKNQWYSSCTQTDSPDGRLWCAVETKYEHETWGYCPTNTKENWNKHPTSGAVYQLNTQSALTWRQAETSCKQQGASLLSITDPHQQAYVTALLEVKGDNQGYRLWTGLTLDSEHGWKWTNGNPFRYLNWDSGHPLSYPGHVCGNIDGSVRFSWQSSTCDKKLGYICYSKGVLPSPTEGVNTGFCSAPWIPYNGHCFHLYRTEKTWSDARSACRKEGGDLTSIRNVEDQSFVISQLGYASTDELWIGFNDKKTEGLFDWTDQSTVSFTSWEFGKPAANPGQEDCVLIRGESGNWADRDCREKHGFICMKTSSPEPSGDEVEENAGCRTGWKRYGSYCYFTGTETKTFDEAKDDCKSSDSYMADVSSRKDNAFLISLVGLRPEKHFWLGLSNQKDTDVFEWTNTKSVRFTHWNSEMPGNHQGCVAMATGSFAGLWDVLPCTNREKYICKHLVEGAIVTPAPPTVPSTTCELDWTKITARNFCYKAFSDSSDRKTWFEARDYCRAIGGDLLSFHNAEEQDLEKKCVPFRYESFWIGLSATDSGAGFAWSDGSPVDYQHWRKGQPDTMNNEELCTEFYPKYFEYNFWNNVHCDQYHLWICQIRTGVTPKPPPPTPTPGEFNVTSDGWLEWKENQYFFNKENLAMEDAQKFCKQKHSDLVTINSQAENTFLRQQMKRNSSNLYFASYWIGLTLDFDKTIQWMDGSPVLFTRWYIGQPDFRNFDENCVAMRHLTGFWHDFNCGQENPSICKRSKSPLANTTMVPTVSPKGGCKENWKKLNSKCYRIINNQNLTWFDAREHCKDMGGNLVSIPSRHVQVFLLFQMSTAQTSDLWIGLHNLYDYWFLWTDGQPRSYMNLDMSESDNHCAVMNTNPLMGIGIWIAKSCNDTYGFICMQNVDQSLPDSPEPTPSTNYVKLFNDSIKHIPQQMSWDAAKKHCEDDGANLASVRSEWTQAYIELLAMNFKTPIWIGLNKAQTKNYFRYIDGWSLKFAHWDKNEPSQNKTCVYVDVDGKWKTDFCSQTISSVCMKSTEVPPEVEPTNFPGVCPEDPEEIDSGRHYYWKPFRRHCYIFVLESNSWSHAAVSCATHGGMLASIEDPNEQEFIYSNIKTYEDRYKSFWTGLFKNHKDAWVWLDKTVMDYTMWQTNEIEVFYYGKIHSSDGRWSGSSPWYYHPYICKRAKVSPDVQETSGRKHITLAVVIIIVGFAVGTIISLSLFKKSGHCVSFPATLTNFDNPLFFSNNLSQPDLVDTKILVENPYEENTETVTI
ncbi:macrophage mannose receptor 1-like [Nematolebias whitei]|uniref:macrophage mannose receptor 1-like n=1 Tax=Nematolebias whitei TaxID=451745 RepID=UPI00189B3AD7|nr:macrophage mannose receptor 1-like [Nematolebias whitei]